MLAALAAALRDRLLADQPASIPGLGVLQRRRVAARVEAGPDGTRTLLPPSETVAFEAGPGDDSLAPALARRLGKPDGGPHLRHAADQVEALLAASGEARLSGVGTFVRTGDGVTFAPAPELLAAVGRAYDGLAPVSTQPASEPPPAADYIDETTLDDDLDDVLAVPFDASGGGLRAILPATLPERDPSTGDESTEDNPDGTESAGADSAARPPDAAPMLSATASPEPPAAAPPATPPSTAEPDSADRGEPGLEWLDGYDSSRNEARPFAGAVVATPAPAEPAVPPTPAAARRPTPEEPAPTEPRRTGAVWLWALLPLLALAALFLWFRSTQDQTPETLTARSETPAPVAPADTSGGVASTAPADTTGRDASAAAGSPSGTAAAVESAALAGEFPVEELGGRTSPGGTTRSEPAPAARPVQTPPARPQRNGVDLPTLDDVDGLDEADRDALAGTAPIVVGRGGYSWVVLSTRERESADRRAEQYREAGWRVRVFQTEALGQTVYRVAIGQFESLSQADRLRPLLPTQVPPDTWRLDLSTL